MTVTRDVILDLLPMYFAGHVSADTKQLVDEFLTSDPDFARMSARFDSLIKARGAAPEGDLGERRALQRARRLLRYRHNVIGLAVAYSLAPFMFVFRNGHVEWVMFHDKPGAAIAFGVTAIGCWIAAFLLGRRVAR